ncbi:MAG: flavin reductase family protein [Candidatus Margulisiibacteriota bacterium]|nr:MAG: flavin reductase [Candidatus Margulisbacteria bacterium GWD2_39_127]OGI04536.1 MAG: flavin reductase [Candidatus Margulisbacteria bacterium GWF2_38_17]OGI07109.1 MAG: flavin reductase [Candidatus Margulisbacteria bacterium GWE2_39_32]PZM82259.1 MAG: flavin reductase family protein [Candidatus Margulisiibacteriota bacterium]HAR62995.1 flavin reductase family protein [Candidatus Margulisiibacteriota bacterium]
MTKKLWKAGTMLYPLPVVMVSCGTSNEEHNIITIAWAGTVCTDPPMLSISLRPSRYSYDIIKKNGEFVVNLTNQKLAFATDFCGVKSGRDINKFTHLKLTPAKAAYVAAPLILESPLNIECRVKTIISLGSHDMFLAEVLGVHVDKILINTNEALNLRAMDPICYSHGKYYVLGNQVGSFGYSVKKKKK